MAAQDRRSQLEGPNYALLHDIADLFTGDRGLLHFWLFFLRCVSVKLPVDISRNQLLASRIHLHRKIHLNQKDRRLVNAKLQLPATLNRKIIPTQTGLPLVPECDNRGWLPVLYSGYVPGSARTPTKKLLQVVSPRHHFIAADNLSI